MEKTTKILMPILCIIFFSFSMKEFSFRFKIEKIENEIVEARFQLTNEIDFSNLEKKLLKVENVISFKELSKRDNYYQINYSQGASLDEIRDVFLEYHTDFDKRHVVVTDKSYYTK